MVNTGLWKPRIGSRNKVSPDSNVIQEKTCFGAQPTDRAMSRRSWDWGCVLFGTLFACRNLLKRKLCHLNKGHSDDLNNQNSFTV